MKNNEVEKSHECYNFPGLLDFLKKYKSTPAKRQYVHKNHKSSNNKGNTFQEEIFKGSHDKNQDGINLHDLKNKVNQNGKGVEELNKMSQKKSHNNNNHNNNINGCFNAFILLSVNKKKKVPSRVSSFEPPKVHLEGVERNLHKAKSLEPIPSLERSRSTNSNKNEQVGMKTPNNSRTPSINRIASTGSRNTSFNGRNGSFNRLSSASIGRSTSDAAAKVPRINSKISINGPIIMFSNSSGLLRPPPTEQTLECTLEELCHGCVKHITVSRNVYTFTGLIGQEEEVLTVNVKPGWKTGTKITFPGTTIDEQQGEYTGDIVFIIIEKRHPLFRRIDDDLELEIEIPLVDSLTGCNINIPLLGKQHLSLAINDIIYPGHQKTFVGQGMPNLKNPNHRGNLNVKFLVGYPKNLTDEQRSEIFRILSG